MFMLRGHPVDAICVIERLFDRRQLSARDIAAKLRFIVTAETYDRVAKLLAKPSFSQLAESVFEAADHADFAPKLLELLVSGESGPNDVFCRSFPRLCREREVPTILDKLSTTRGNIHQALIEGLGAAGDRRGWETLKREMFDDEKQIWAATALANFRGDDVIALLRQRLKGGNVQSRAFTARVLADKGDTSGIPVILEDLGKEQEGIWFVMDRLAEITGRNVGEDFWAKKLTREQAHEWLEAWWAKNKSRSRVDWLLDAVAEAEPYSGNPLVTMAKNDLKEMESEAPTKWGEAAVPRIRGWIEKTQFRFDRDTVRVPYRKIP